MSLDDKLNTNLFGKMRSLARKYLGISVFGIGLGLFSYSCGSTNGQSSITGYDGQAPIEEVIDYDQNDGRKDIHPNSKTCLQDKDNDNYGIKENNVIVGWDEECPDGYKILLPPFDCNDNVKSINPGAIELCNNLDDNCNGEKDEGIEEVCHTNCGDGKMTCTAGVFGECNVPKPTEEICNGKDDDCDGQVDELTQCCKPNDIKNKKICADGALKEEDICIYYNWVHQTYIDECLCVSAEWVCKNQVIGKQCVDPFDENDFTPQNIDDQMVNDPYFDDTCINEWCCKNEEGKEYGCWNDHIEIDCYCVTGFDAVYEDGEHGFSEGGACPKHDFCDTDTDVEVLMRNDGSNAVEVWLNWSNYGYPPGEKRTLQPGQTTDYTIDGKITPVEGTTIQICNSYEGCAEDIQVNCGDKNIVYREISAVQDYETCNRETEITASFNNFKTLDLVVWINWLSQGFPPMEMPTIHPDGTYTYYIDEKNIPKEGAFIELCTSSYGCSQPIEIKCGDKIYANVDWVFGSVPKTDSGNNNNNNGE